MVFILLPNKGHDRLPDVVFQERWVNEKEKK